MQQSMYIIYHSKYVSFSFFLFLNYSFCYFIHNFLKNLFLAALGLCCCAWALSSCSERGLCFIAVHGLLTVVASLVMKHGL